MPYTTTSLLAKDNCSVPVESKLCPVNIENTCFNRHVLTIDINVVDAIRLCCFLPLLNGCVESSGSEVRRTCGTKIFLLPPRSGSGSRIDNTIENSFPCFFAGRPGALLQNSGATSNQNRRRSTPATQQRQQQQQQQRNDNDRQDKGHSACIDLLPHATMDRNVLFDILETISE